MLSIFRRMVELSPIHLLLLLAVILVISIVNVAGYVWDHKKGYSPGWHISGGLLIGATNA